VKLCKLKEEPETKHAVKIMRVPDKEYFDIAMKEYKLLEEIREHPNIMQVYDIYYN
jgi:hypothetical protein